MSEEASSSQPEKVFPITESRSERDLKQETADSAKPDFIDKNEEIIKTSKHIIEEKLNKYNEICDEALKQLSEENLDNAIELFTEAIKLNPSSAVLFAKRGHAYLEKNRLNDCINDCNRSIELNANLAAAYKFRGRAYSLIGEWVNAAKDLRQSCDMKFDKQTDKWLKVVEANAKKIELYKLKKERKRMEKEEQKKLEKAREAQAKASTSSDTNTKSNADDFYALFEDPEVTEALADREVSAAFADILSEPANIYKYHSNLKLMLQLSQLSQKFSKTGNYPVFPSEGFFVFEDTLGGGEASAPFQQADDSLN